MIITSTDSNPELEYLLDLVVREENAQKGTLQRFNSLKNELEVVASKGFSHDFLDHFKTVKPFDASCCGRAIGVGSTIVISDVELDHGFKPHLEIARSQGFRAVKATPVYDADGSKLGVVSVHFAEPKWDWNFKKSEVVLFQLAEVLKQYKPAMKKVEI